MSDTEKIDAYNGPYPYIFLSYPHKDSAIVQKLLKQLYDNDYRVWYDEGIKMSNNWRKVITKNIKNCTHFIAVITSNYLKSPDCIEELVYFKNVCSNNSKNYAGDDTTYSKDPLTVLLCDGLRMEQLPDYMQMMLGSTQARSIEKDETFDENSDVFNDLIHIPSIIKCQKSYAEVKLSKYKAEEEAALKKDKNYCRFRQSSSTLALQLYNNSFPGEEIIKNEIERIIPFMERLSDEHKAPYSVCETARMIMYISARWGNAEKEKAVARIYNETISFCAPEPDIIVHIDTTIKKADIPENINPDLALLAGADEPMSSEAETSDVSAAEKSKATSPDTDKSKAVKPALKGIDELAAGYRFDKEEPVEEIVVKKENKHIAEADNKSGMNGTAPQKKPASANRNVKPTAETDSNKAVEQSSVYISFSRQNREVAEKLCRMLEQKGINCRFDMEIVPMDKNWIDPITDKIKSSDAFIVIHSIAWTLSNYLKQEFDTAKENNIPIVAYTIDSTPISEYYLNNISLISANIANNDYKINELCQAVKNRKKISKKNTADSSKKSDQTDKYNYDLGAKLYNEGKKEEAEKCLRLAADNGNTNAQNILGLLLEELGKKDEAEKYYRLAADNGNTDAQYNLGLLLYELDKKDEAENYLRLAADNGNTKAQNNLGVLLEGLGKKDEAEKYYRLAADNGNTNAQNNLGELLETLGKTEEAEKYYRMAADSGHTEAQTALKALLEKKKEKPSLDSIVAGKASDKDIEETNNSTPQSEIDKLRSAADNGNVYAQNNYGELLEALGRTEEAERYYRIAADKGHKAAQSNLGSLLFKQGRKAEAEKYLLLAADIAHTKSQDDNKALSEINEKETILEDEEKITSPNPEELSHPVLNSMEIAEQYKLGIQYELSGKTEEAVKYYRLAADNGDVTAQYNLGCLLNKLGRTDEAIKYYSMAANNGDATAQYSYGFLLEEMDKKDEAEKYYRMAANNEDTTAKFTLIALLDELGRKDESDEYLRTIFDNYSTTEQLGHEGNFAQRWRQYEVEQYYRSAANKGNAIAQKYLGYLLEHTDRKEEAEIYYRSAANNGNMYAQMHYAYILKSSSRTEEAEKYYRLAADNGNADAQYNLGLILDLSGRKEEAVKYYRLASDNGDSSAQNNLGILFRELGKKDEAEKYYRMAVNNGNAKALKNLSIFLENTGKKSGTDKYLRTLEINHEVVTEAQKRDARFDEVLSITDEQISAILKKIMKKHSLSDHTFIHFLGKPAFEKKINKAVAAYVKTGFYSYEKALLMEDSTIFGSAKEGFIMTDHSFYIQRSHSPMAHIFFHEINEIHIIKSHDIYEIILTYEYFIREQTLTSSLSESKILHIFECISDLITQLQSGTFGDN